MKYDCNRTMEYAHEMKRMCRSYPTCTSCPIRGMSYFSFQVPPRPTQEIINIVQMWSDEHPETPKLTQKEKAFIGAFVAHGDKRIERSSAGLYIMNILGNETHISPDMFTFIGEGESMTFSSLYKLEVESEDE